MIDHIITLMVKQNEMQKSICSVRAEDMHRRRARACAWWYRRADDDTLLRSST